MGARFSDVLPPHESWDVDLVVSHEEPYWPDARGSLRDNARPGPLSNDARLWLTATSFIGRKNPLAGTAISASSAAGPGAEPDYVRQPRTRRGQRQRTGLWRPLLHASSSMQSLPGREHKARYPLVLLIGGVEVSPDRECV